MKFFQRIQKKCKLKIRVKGKEYSWKCKYKVSVPHYKVRLLDCAKKWDFEIKQKNNILAKVKNGKIIIYKGYVWNGADYVDGFFDGLLRVSDTQEATLVHDVLCWAIRTGKLNNLNHRECVDDHLYCLLMKNRRYHTARIMYSATRFYQSTGQWLFIGVLGGFLGLFNLTKLPNCLYCDCKCDCGCS